MNDYISVDISAQFTLTFTLADIQHLVTRIYSEGIGDWCVLDTEHTDFSLIQLTDIATNCTYCIDLQELESAICTAWLDFPYALDVQSGCSLCVDRLSGEDIDEIVQIAIFGSMQYSWTW